MINVYKTNLLPRLWLFLCRAGGGVGRWATTDVSGHVGLRLYLTETDSSDGPDANTYTNRYPQKAAVVNEHLFPHVIFKTAGKQFQLPFQQLLMFSFLFISNVWTGASFWNPLLTYFFKTMNKNTLSFPLMPRVTILTNDNKQKFK